MWLFYGALGKMALAMEFCKPGKGIPIVLDTVPGNAEVLLGRFATSKLFAYLCLCRDKENAGNHKKKGACGEALSCFIRRKEKDDARLKAEKNKNNETRRGVQPFIDNCFRKGG